MWPVTSVRCDSFSLRRRLSSSRAALFGDSDISVSFDFVIDDGAEIEFVVCDFWEAVVVTNGDVVSGALRAEAAAIIAGLGTGVEASGAAGCPIAVSTDLGIRTDFLHRGQSNNFTVAVELTTIGAEQCGQSKRRSLLAVPVSDAPPFCITLRRVAVIIP